MTPPWLGYTRARQWWHFLALPVAGVALDPARGGGVLAAVAATLAGAAALAYGYLLNAVADRGMDLDRRKNPLLGEAPVSLRWPLAALATAALASAGLVSTVAVAAVVTMLVSGWCYSAGPRWKSVPLLGTAMNVANFTPLLFLGVRDGARAGALLPLALAFAALLLQNQLLHEAADAEEDRRGGLRTTFAALGAGGAAVAALLCAVGLGGVVLHGFAEHPARAWALALCAPASLLAPVALASGLPPERAASARRWHRAGAAVVGAALFALSLTRAGV